QMKETDRQMKETDRQMKETDRQMKETDRQMKKTDRRLESLAGKMEETDRQMKETDRRLESLAGKMKETDRQMKETDRRFEEVAAQMEETDRRLKEHDRLLQEHRKETDRQIKENDRKFAERRRELEEYKQERKEAWAKTDRVLRQLKKQMGQLGNKFGSYTEGLALPSMRKVLRETFQLDCIGARVLRRQNGREIEIDVVGYTHHSKIDTVVAVEVKSKLSHEELNRTLEKLGSFFEYFTEHRGKKLYGIIVAVEIPEDVKRRVMSHGLYLAEISDDTFRLKVPDGFDPTTFAA
nr:hypothetical protein [Acidobacteriota bacterium]